MQKPRLYFLLSANLQMFAAQQAKLIFEYLNTLPNISMLA